MTISTMDDVLIAIRAVYALAGDDTPVLIGERHLAQIGTVPRIVFVVATEDGNVGPVPRVGAGYVAGITEIVKCYLWGAETVEDEDRYRDVKAMAMRLINALKRCAPGRLSGLKLGRTAASDDTFGENYQMRIAYTWGVPKDDAIWNVPATGTNLSPPDPDKPNGDTGQTISTGSITAANERS